MSRSLTYLKFNRASTSIRTLCDTGCPSSIGRNTYGPFDWIFASGTVDDRWTSYTECAVRNEVMFLIPHSLP